MLSTTSWGYAEHHPLVPYLSITEKTVFKKERYLAVKDWVTTKPMKKEQLPLFQDFRDFSPQPRVLVPEAVVEQHSMVEVCGAATLLSS